MEDFISLIENDPAFRKVLGIVERNSLGDIWLVGGFVYRNLAHCLYNTKKPEVDFDFLVEKPKPEIVLPSGWRLKINGYGNPKFFGEGLSVDFVPLSNVYSILRRKLEPSFENYLTGTPLTVQSIGYNVGDGRIIGDIGVGALLDSTVGVNNLEEAVNSSSRRGLTVEEMVERKALELGFRAVFG